MEARVMAGNGKLLARLPRVALSDSRRPLYLPTEVEHQLFDCVDLEFDERKGAGNNESTLKGGLVYVTSHRIIWVESTDGGGKASVSSSYSFSSASTSHSSSASTIAGSSVAVDNGRGGGLAIPLSYVSDINVFSRSFLGTPRARIRLSSGADGSPVVAGSESATCHIDVVAVFRGKPKYDRFVAKAAEALRAKSWLNDPPEHPTQSPALFASGSGSGFPGTSAARGGTDVTDGRNEMTAMAAMRRSDPSLAGVGGLLRKEQQQLQETDRNMQQAFSDLNALMANARKMVSIAQMMRAKLGSGDAGEEAGSKQEMEDWLLSFGIVSPVTRETAGALYHQQLARQLADFVRIPLERAGGMLSLVDTYCMFNRARGTELISPQDLLQACQIWEKIDVPTRIRKFDSGVIVIQAKSHSDEEIFSKLLLLVHAAPDRKMIGLSATDAAQALGLAPIVAKEELLAAEKKGLLCRDDSMEGLRFYYNFFTDLELSSVS